MTPERCPHRTYGEPYACHLRPDETNPCGTPDCPCPPDERGHFERTPPICIKHRIPAEPIDGEPVVDGHAAVWGWQCPLCWLEWMQEIAMRPRYNFPCWHTPITPPKS